VQLGYLIVLLAVLMTPLVVIAVMSFNRSRLGTLPISWTFQWYRALLQRDELLRATVLSLELGAAVAVTCAVLGSALAIWLVRYAGRAGRAVVGGFLLAAVTIPWLVLGVAMLLVLQAIGIGRSYVGMFLGNAAVVLPYVVLIVAVRLRGVDPSVEEAARSLGASPVAAFFRVLLPSIAPAIVAGTMMAFVVCFNNFVMQYFLAPFGVQTLPIRIFGLIRIGYEPDINALATILIVITMIPVLVVQRLLYGRADAEGVVPLG
jgi:spermidine/putrescine transport system permease protein